MKRPSDGDSFELLTCCRGKVVYTGSWRHTESCVVVRYGGREVHVSLYQPGKPREIAQNLLSDIVESYERHDPSSAPAEISFPAVVTGEERS
jgi:hypothetical protein